MNYDRLSNGATWRRIALVAALGAALSGCATTGNPKDPFETFNRGVFVFNDTVDKVALKPAATAYKKVLPSFVQTGISNFFGNLADLWTAANNLMQGKGHDGLSDLTRVALNSTLGLAGLLDIASEAGLQKHNEDFGQTLAVWGVPSGPYLMLPLLGPSTLRDASGLPLDIAADPWIYKEPVNWRNVGVAVRTVDQRAAVLDASNLLEDAALDRYEFIRDGFLQRRESRIHDGSGPRRNKDGQDEASSGAALIKAAYADDPGATPEPAAAADAQLAVAAPDSAGSAADTVVSSETATK